MIADDWLSPLVARLSSGGLARRCLGAGIYSAGRQVSCSFQAANRVSRVGSPIELLFQFHRLLHRLNSIYTQGVKTKRR